MNAAAGVLWPGLRPKTFKTEFRSSQTRRRPESAADRGSPEPQRVRHRENPTNFSRPPASVAAAALESRGPWPFRLARAFVLQVNFGVRV